jgi:hypothetical protein
MNLHNIAGNYVAAVNPWLTAQYQQSTGYTTGADGTRTPSYAPAVAVQVQKQPMQYRDLVQIDGLNLNGEKAAFYVNGNWQGVARPTGRGGDLITLPNGSVWLVVMLLENWSEMDSWSKVACVLQDNS